MSKKKDTSPKVHQNEKIRETIKIDDRTLTPKQIELLNLLQNKTTKLDLNKFIDHSFTFIVFKPRTTDCFLETTVNSDFSKSKLKLGSTVISRACATTK